VGGFGAVYRVRHDVSDDIFALKLLHGHLAREPAIVRSFLDEVKRPASFSKVVGTFGRVPRERVVRVTDAGIDAALESPFMVMPLLEGEGLHDRLGREGRLPPAVALDLLKDLACVLDEAHSGGNPIVHRDLKPENLFVERREHGEQLRVLDFGIAKAANASGNETLRVFGTPQFMAPEQWDPAGDVTPRTDVWALGLIAFNALVGASFWPATHHHQLAPLVLLRPIPRASERAQALGVALPPAFDAWFTRCVARAPHDRFESAGRAVAALEAATAAWPGLPPAPPPPPGAGLTRPSPKLPAPGVGLDVRLRNRQRLPVGEVRALLHEVVEKVEGVRSREARDVSLALTPEHVRFVPNGSKEDVALWEPQPPPETSAERRGTRTLVARFGVSDFAYFAPETLRSAKGSEQADVWSLAVLSFEALVGVRFWPQESIPALLHAMESDPVPTASARAAAVHDAPALPEGFDGWFARCTARDPGGRYRTPTHALLGFEKLFVQPPSPRPTRRGFVLAAAGVVAVVALVAAVGRAVIERPEPHPPAVADARPVVTPIAPLACGELPSRGNPFVRVANIGCVQQHEVSEREYAAWRDGGTTSLMPQRDVARGDAAAYCRGLGATLPPARLWDLLAHRRGSLTTRINFPQGDDAQPVGHAPDLDDFEGVRDLVGNLAEWTSDPPLPNGRLMVRGARFNSLPDEVLTQVQEGESVPDRPSPQRGFRCAVVREGP